MNPIDILVMAVIAAIIGFAIWYICRAKKKGVKCIGCPDGAKCSGHCDRCSGNCCSRAEDEKK